MELKVFYFSAQGASHIKKNKECQDWSGSYCDEKCAIAVVCDGHGGNDYVRSGVGSKIACEVAKKDIKKFIDSVMVEELNKKSDELLERLEASIISGWVGSVRQDFKERPFTDDELKNVSEKAKEKYREGEIEGAYGTTLIAVAMTRDYWFGLQIGDGKCVAVTKESQFGKPIPRNDKCFLNATTSICDKEALTNFRHRYSQKFPAAIFVGSDGVDDSFSNDEQLYALYRTILYSFGTTDFDEAKKDLEDYLPRLSAKGSGDDVSIAAIFDMDAIAELSIVKDFDPEKEKTRIAEAERRKAEQREAERREAERRRAEYQEAERRKAEQRETERRRAERRKEEQKEAASVARRQMRPSFCTYCGAKLSGGIYCPQCGEKVMEHQTDSESYNTSGRKNELREASVAVTAKTKIPHAAVDSAALNAEDIGSTDHTVLDNVSVKNKSDAKEVFSQEACENVMPEQEISEQEVSEQEISKKEIFKQEISEQEISGQEVSEQEISEQEVSEQEVSGQEISESGSSDKQTTDDISPDNTECENEK